MLTGGVNGLDLHRWAGSLTLTSGGRRFGRGIPSTDKKKTMRTITKLAPLGHSGGRSPLSDMLGHVRRALASASDRRTTRPLQDIDGWSDQAEIAYYEDCRAGRAC